MALLPYYKTCCHCCALKHCILPLLRHNIQRVPNAVGAYFKSTGTLYITLQCLRGEGRKEFAEEFRCNEIPQAVIKGMDCAQIQSALQDNPAGVPARS